MPYHSNHNSKAFTLLELMISIAIVSMLAGAAIPQFQKYMQRSKMTEGYLFLRKMHDTAVVNGSVQYATAIDKDDGQTYTCLKQYPFGQIRSYRIGEYGLISAPPAGKKEVMYFYQNSYYDPVQHYNVSGNIVCSINNNAFPNPESYGFAVENVDSETNYIPMINPTYFAVSSYPSYQLTQNLIAAGKNVAYYDTQTQRFMSSSISVYADLDGDYELEYDEDEEEYSSALLEASGGSDKIAYLMRGIYYDTVSGEITSTDGIYQLNFGE